MSTFTLLCNQKGAWEVVRREVREAEGWDGEGVLETNFRLGNLRVSVGFTTAVTYAHSQKMQLKGQRVALRTSFCRQGIKAWKGEVICLMPHSEGGDGAKAGTGRLDSCHPTVPLVEIPKQNKLTGPGRGQVGGESQRRL